MCMVKNAGQVKRAAAGALLLLITGLLAGCATQIRMNMLLPADYHEASLTKTVAVLPFGGPDGAAATAEFEAVLGGINIDDKRYFKDDRLQQYRNVENPHDYMPM